MNALNVDDENDKIIIDRILSTPELPQQPELHIHVVIPNEFQPIAKYNIGITEPFYQDTPLSLSGDIFDQKVEVGQKDIEKQGFEILVHLTGSVEELH